jgi:transposase
MTVTVLTGPERRRRWTTAEKLRIVEESEAAGAIANEVARRYDIHPHQLHKWRHDMRRGRLVPALATEGAGDSGPHFVPLAVATAGEKNSSSQDVAARILPIELVLRNGRVMRLRESVPPAQIAALADALEGLAR